MENERGQEYIEKSGKRKDEKVPSQLWCESPVPVKAWLPAKQDGPAL